MALNVVSYGTGRPVLALHGVTGHARRWKLLDGELPGIALHAVDLRGHGFSPWTPPWSVDQHVADVVEVLDTLGPGRVPVVAHSFGAMVALHLARAAPERVERLVLLDPAIGLDPQRMLDAAELTRTDESYPDLATARAARAEAWGAGVADELVDDELELHLVQDGERFSYRYCRPAVITAWSELARPAVLPPAGMPTLLMPAVRGGYVDPAWVRACREALGGALTVVELDSGHMVVHERTAEVAAAVRSFLAP